MNQMTEHNEATAQMPDASAGPGARLRVAREARAMSVSEVAKQLHLDAKLIQALEAEDFAQIPAPTFVYGYLRSYARLLNLPESEIIAGYRHEGSAPSLLPNIELKPQAKSSDTPVRLVTYVLVIGLAVLVGTWWFNEGSEHMHRLFGAAPTAPTLAQPNNTPIATARPSAPAPTTGLAPAPTAAANADLSSVPAAPAASPAPVAPEPASSPAQQSPAPPTAATPTATQTGTPSSIATSKAAIPAAVRVVTADKKPLVLHYDADSWTDVRDSTGAQLIYELVEAGRTVTVSGVPPFTVLLGYAPGVSIDYDGKLVNPTRYNSKDVGRFSVGAADPGAPRSLQ